MGDPAWWARAMPAVEGLEREARRTAGGGGEAGLVGSGRAWCASQERGFHRARGEPLKRQNATAAEDRAVEPVSCLAFAFCATLGD